MGSPLSQPLSHMSNMKIQYPSLPMILRVGSFLLTKSPPSNGNNKKRWNGTAMGVEFAGLGDEVLAAMGSTIEILLMVQFHPATVGIHPTMGNPKPSFLGGYDPYIEGLKPSFFMVLGSKGRWWRISWFNCYSANGWILQTWSTGSFKHFFHPLY